MNTNTTTTISPNKIATITATIKDLERADQWDIISSMLSKYGHHLDYSPYTEGWLKKYITQDPELIELKDKVRKLAHCKWSDVPVLLVGETGTGKELLAQALHGNRVGKIIEVNCTSLPDTLIESELFGHKKGAFTDAREDRVGKFEAAQDGTIFLDEIGDMGLVMQAKLLRVLESRRFHRLGCNADITTNARVVAATNKDLRAMIKTKEFREDLYHRLAVVVLHTKPLRDREGDLELIAKEAFGYETIAPEMLSYDWPGNVRELENFITREKIFGS